MKAVLLVLVVAAAVVGVARAGEADTETARTITEADVALNSEVTSETILNLSAWARDEECPSQGLFDYVYAPSARGPTIIRLR